LSPAGAVAPCRRRHLSRYAGRWQTHRPKWEWWTRIARWENWRKSTT
jgi:hypothetical protein